MSGGYNMATPFLDTCSVAVTNTYDTCGSLTKAKISTLTPEQIKALFTDGSSWNELNSLLKHQFEMKACGIRRNGFYDWIMTSNKPGMGKLINIERRDRSASLVRPYILGRQMSVVNTDYWAVTNGYATGAYTVGTTGPLTSVAGGDRVVRVTPGYGTYIDSAQFLGDVGGKGGHSLFILNKASGDSTAQIGQWRIKDSALATDGTYVDILLVDRNAGSASAYDTTPTAGIAVVGVNNVNDVEQWCKNPANYNATKLVPFFYQTSRRTRCVDDQYLEVQKKLLADNAWFAEFADLPLAERNRQDEMEDQKQFVHQFLFGRAGSANQTLTGWGSLEQITSVSGASIDPGTGGKLIAYRADIVGVEEQLRACSQVTDRQGATLSLTTFLETYIYNVYRSRQSHGSASARNIDVYTDINTANDFRKQFVTYAKTKYGVDNVNMHLTDQDSGSEMAPLGFTWMSYKLPMPNGVILNVIAHETFDDLRNVFASLNTPDTTSGRYLMVLDLGKGGTIYPAVLATNRKVYRTGELEQLARIDSTFACVMENPTQIRTLTSQTATAIVECPKNSYIVKNFSGFTT